MILNQSIIEDVRAKSGLSFEKTKDVDLLATFIFEETGRNIGVTTLKRLLGLINDDRKSNEFTLNTIAIYLGFKSWQEYSATKNLDSVWNFVDASILIEDMPEGAAITVHYLNRIIYFVVELCEGKKVLVVKKAQNSSLQEGDILYIHKITKGEPLVADKVIRGVEIGNYKTNGEVCFINVVE